MPKLSQAQLLVVLISVLLPSFVSTETGHFNLSTTAFSFNASPSVVSTVVTDGNGLKLLVLWRGSVAWYLSAGHRTDHYSGNQEGEITIALHYDRVKLDLSFQPTQHTARLQEKALTLAPNANVLLIDGVDSKAGPSLLQSVAIDTSKQNVDPRRGPVTPIFRQSPDIVAFLRCDDQITDKVLANNPDAQKAQEAGVSTNMMNQMVHGVCAELKVK